MKIIYTIAFIIAISGCATKRVIIDTKGVDMTMYNQDLEDCTQYAKEVESGAQVAKSAVGGAVGAIIGGHRSAERLAGVGAVTGVARGGRSANREKTRLSKIVCADVVTRS